MRFFTYGSILLLSTLLPKTQSEVVFNPSNTIELTSNTSNTPQTKALSLQTADVSTSSSLQSRSLFGGIAGLMQGLINIGSNILFPQPGPGTVIIPPTPTPTSP